MKKPIFILLSLASFVMLTACENTSADNHLDNVETPLLMQVEQQLQLAKKSADFRLFHTLGRRLVVPGFEQQDTEQLRKKCGLKPLANTGDVLKSVEHKQQRLQKYQFAKQYNQRVFILCTGS